MTKCKTCKDTGRYIPDEPWNLSLQEHTACPDCNVKGDIAMNSEEACGVCEHYFNCDKERQSSCILERTEKARELLQVAVHENFGYVGDDPWACKSLEKCKTLEKELKINNPEAWAVYAEKWY